MHTHARVAVSPVLFVTSCVVLYGRGVDDTAARVLRGSKRYKPEASVLLQVEFWRVCLDEAQTVESTTAKAAEMASKLHAGVLPCPARCLKSLSPTPPVSPSPCPDALAHWLSAKQLANALCLCRCPTRPPNVSSGPAACSAAARTRRHTVMAVLQLALPWCACLLDALASCPAPV